MESITLDNYRCFEHLHLDFSDKINLLIGDNASGKTTIVRAVSAALSSFLTGFSDQNTKFSGLEKEDFRIIKADGGLANEEPIKVDFTWLGKKASLELKSIKGRTLQDPLKPIKELGKATYKNLFQYNKQVIALPLFTSFSTSDIHKPRKFGRAIFAQYEHKPSFGYFECLQGDGFMDYWTLRLLALQEGQTGELEVTGVLNALKSALGKDGCNILSNVEIRYIQGKVYYYLNDGRLTTTENLSDGLRRLVNIVLDLSFRCMLLNKGIYGLEACSKTTGTVLIDEIDLHLHPTLQSVVMKGLQHAFPNLQFIITSHAPMIMTGIPMDNHNKIIKLTYDEKIGYKAKEIEAYGLDASTIIQSVLDVVPRSPQVEEKLKTLFDLLDSDEYEEATVVLNKMQEEFGDKLPELAKAESMLNFLTVDDDDTNP
jgi:predicted ATP-binding protein involved in virulence